MASKTNRANFGSVRKLPSARWQARYPAEDGSPMNAPLTFETSREARQHISTVQADRLRNVYHDYRKGDILLTGFAADWIANGGSRGKLAVRTRELYEDLLSRHIGPTIGTMPVGKITPTTVRGWHTALRKELAARASQPLKADGLGTRKATGETRLRQAYALLRSIMAEAEREGLIHRNPCNIKGAGSLKAQERPLMSVVDFDALVAALPADLRPVAHLTFGGHLRLGEVVGLRRGDLDLKSQTLTVLRQVVQARTGIVVTDTKTGTSRTVVLPGATVDAMRQYLTTVPTAMPSTPMFIRANGSALTRAQVQHAWKKARTATGLEQFHFHDLRHAGLTLSAQSGATLRELMDRAGHSTSAAAMAYQHAAEARGKVIAEGMNALMNDLREAERQTLGA
ncbi:hypothetical protein E3T23_01775 [Cryobacterium cheniae]|uniref:Tyr recombinase domain-containing protein n=1 Tax=Cryobacterium cheniae TaxID=1259262 RepID=A0A4R8XWF8_9MICO|nr:site-specific integrase [Cryobacterium cheniae]TFC83714.1 hypothetical protein E3T23_01775 [Cryobacterium cheniae]